MKNENVIIKYIKKTLLLSRIYSIPILVLLVGFGIYYSIFEAVHEFEEELNSTYIQELTQGKTQTIKEQDLMGQAQPLDTIKKEASPDAITSINATQEANVIIDTTSITTIPDQSSKPTKSQPTIAYIVNTNTLNIRQEPHINSPIIARLEYGEKIDATDEKEGWIKSKEGWVAKEFLVSFQSVPILYEVKLKIINVRQNPTLNAPVVTKKGRGSILIPLEEKANWIRTAEGWVYKPLLKKMGE